MNNLISLKEWDPELISDLIDLAKNIKDDPRKFSEKMVGRSLLMIFEKPSLRTRLSFEAGMTQMGGHAIYYHLGSSPMGSGKESISDSIKVASRYVDLIMARLFNHDDLIEMANYSSVPLINALTDDSHPCQILADLLTIDEKKGDLKNLKLSYFGDGYNNVTHSLMIGGVKMGMNVFISTPPEKKYLPREDVVKACEKISNITSGSITITSNVEEAALNSDIIYTDSWMSYHIPKEDEKKRINDLMPFQVNEKLLSLAKSDVLFMNCLPATRGYEQTAEVIDGNNSIVFDQAENRLHMQKAIMLNLLKL